MTPSEHFAASTDGIMGLALPDGMTEQEAVEQDADQRYEGMREVLRMIQRDAESDASSIDGQPFEARIIAEHLGKMYAMIQTLARAIDVVAEQAHDHKNAIVDLSASVYTGGE